MPATPVEMARAIGRGLLSFPVTHFDADNRFDVEPLSRPLRLDDGT